MTKTKRILLVAMAVAAGGCASDAVTDSEYDEVARIMGAGLKTGDGGGDLGAVADTARLAAGMMPSGFKRTESGVVVGRHGEFTHRYFVICTDARNQLVDPCGAAAQKALVLAYWTGPFVTEDHEGTLRRGGYWEFYEPFRTYALAVGDTWLEYVAPDYRVNDDRDVLLTVDMMRATVTHGGMDAGITVEHEDTGETIEMLGNVELDAMKATITLDGVYDATVDLAPIFY